MMLYCQIELEMESQMDTGVLSGLKNWGYDDLTWLHPNLCFRQKLGPKSIFCVRV